MSKPAKAARTTYPGRTSLPPTADHDVLHFLTRTLNAHCIDAKPSEVLVKLENLKHALAQQEIKLSDWPDSPSKERICQALTKAMNLVEHIVDELAAGAPTYGAFGNAEVG